MTNTNDSNGRVHTQTLADTWVFEFDYTLDGSGNVTQTDLTNQRGYVTRYAFNAAGYHTSVTEAGDEPGPNDDPDARQRKSAGHQRDGSAESRDRLYV